MLRPFKHMLARCLTGVLLGLGLAGSLQAPVQAQDSKSDRLNTLIKRAVSDRIVIAGRQRMLAEGMAAKLCFKVSGIQDAAAQRDLYTMWNIFGWYHAGLRHGNPQLQLNAERNLIVLDAWRQMDQIWGGLNGVYEGVLSTGQADPETLAIAVDLTDIVTDGSTMIVAALRSAYADQLGPQGFGSALLIDLYERQRMLGQKIAKDICLLSRDQNARSVDDLNQTLKIFTVSMQAFQTGLADVGVPPPPTPEIAAKLAKASEDWQVAGTRALAAINGNPLTQEELAEFARSVDLFISDMTGIINALVEFQSG